MYQKALAPDLFRSRLIPFAAVFYTLAALCGIPGLLLLFNSSYTQLWYQEMLLSGITSGLAAWRLIDIAVTFFSFVCPAVMSIGLWLTIRKNTLPGMNLLTAMARCLFHGTTVTGAMALIYLIYRSVRYIAYCTTKNEGIYLLYTALIPEALMVLQAWFLWKKLREFLDAFGDTAISITYTLTSGKLDPYPAPNFAITGLVILAVFGFFLAMDEVFTVTIAYNYPNAYYKLLTATHWGQYFAGFTLFAGAAANVLTALYLRRYNHLRERAIFFARKQKT